MKTGWLAAMLVAGGLAGGLAGCGNASPIYPLGKTIEFADGVGCDEARLADGGLVAANCTLLLGDGGVLEVDGN